MVIFLKVHTRKILSLLLATALSLSVFVVPSFAADVSYTYEVPNFGAEFLDLLGDMLGSVFDVSNGFSSPSSVANAIDWPVPTGLTYSASEMAYVQKWYNSGGYWGRLVNLFPAMASFGTAFMEKTFGVSVPARMQASMQPDTIGGREVYHLRTNGGHWVVNADGKFPYVDAAKWEEYISGVTGSVVTGPSGYEFLYTGEGSRDLWVNANDINQKTLTGFVVVSPEAIYKAKQELSEKYPDVQVYDKFRRNGTPYYVLFRPNAGGYGAFYCNCNGVLYAAYTPEAESSSVTNQQRPVNQVVSGGSTTDVVTNVNNDNRVINNDDRTITIINENGDKITQDILNEYYNIDDHSYTVTTYNTQNNTYNYYTYNIQYTYNNTYVTYIGSTAEYQPKEWALYYELPDGRSSADLTEEDIAGLSFQFNDVVNYKRSATDTSLRALYHFDGNTNDSSYWSTQGDFTWNTGASITYMESNAFNGALYLDEKTHDFTITLPSNIGSGDFSLQWRYYQNSATTSTNMDNYVTVGGQKLLQWSEHTLYNGSGTKVGDLSVGTWQELALVRNKGTLYIYHNGVKLASVALSSVLANQIIFHLGPASKAYAMLDELRFVNFAIAQAGAAYTPTAVPYDTNSVLILPDGVFPVAEEHWEWDTTITPSFAIDLSTGFVPVVDFTTGSSPYAPYPSLGKIVRRRSSYFSVSDGFCSVNTLGAANTLAGYGSAYRFDSDGTNLFIPVDEFTGLWKNWKHKYFGTYTVSFVLSDGTIHSGTVSVSNSNRVQSWVICGPLKFCFIKGAVYCQDSSSDEWATVLAFGLTSASNPVDLVYLEIVPGTQGNTGHKFVSAVYSSDEIQPNTAAVQSDIPIHGYTVGGVRPTFPERGDVWFPVEGSRISGVYIYNGQAWEQTNARWWTGKRWIPIYAFDLVTLQDCWDVTSSDGPGTEVTPPISSDYGFWNWWKAQWLDFRAWLEKALNNSGGSGDNVFFPPIEGECDHTYREKIMTRPSCTLTGTALYTCSKCGDTYTAELDALGHDWVMDDSIPDELDEEGNVLKAGYDLYTCTRCGVQHKDFTRTGPPGSEDGSTITQLIQQLFDSLGNLVGGLIDWILELAKEAIAGFGSLGDYFKEKAEEVQGFGGEFVSFFGAFFEVIPPEIVTLISLALVFLGLGLFIKNVLF